MTARPAALAQRRRALALALLGAACCAAAPARGQPVPPDLDTPFVTTPDDVVRAMLELAVLRPGDRLIDLGSGDGRIVIEAARRGATAHGIEIDPRLVALSRERARQAGLADRATFAAQDLFETDVASADVVTMYLLPDVNARLAPRLYATLRPGARVVSHDYGLGDWPADATIEVDAPGKTVGARKRSTVMRWTVPADLRGVWRGQAGGVPLALDVVQSWQRVSGTLRWRARDHRFADQRVDGPSLVLDIAPDGVPSLTLRLAAASDGQLSGALHEEGRAALGVMLRRG